MVGYTSARDFVVTSYKYVAAGLKVMEIFTHSQKWVIKRNCQERGHTLTLHSP